MKWMSHDHPTTGSDNGLAPIRLTHWGRVTHICVSKLTIIGLDNGLSPGRRQAIIWTNAGILLIGPLGTNFNEILIGNQTFSFKKMHMKMSSAKWRPFCLGLNVLTHLVLGFKIHWSVCLWVQLTMSLFGGNHYLNQYWVVVNWTFRNTLQRNFNQNTEIFIHENVPEIIQGEMS